MSQVKGGAELQSKNREVLGGAEVLLSLGVLSHS